MRKRFLLVALVVFAAVCVSCLAVSCGFPDKDDVENAVDNTKKVLQCFYDGAELTWTEVKDVIRYDILKKEDGKEDVVTNKGVEGNTCVYESGDDKVDIIVRSYYKDENGEERYVDSDFSFTRLNNPITKPTIDYGVIHWDAVPGVDEYVIKIDNKPFERVKTNQYEIGSGSHSFSVKPVLPKTSTQFYSFSQELNVNVIAQPVIKFDKATKAIIWNRVNDASGYYITIEKDNKSQIDIPPLGREAVSYNGYEFYDVGTYKVKVACKGDAEANKNDSHFAEMEITRLAAPTLKAVRDDGNRYSIEWNLAPNANLYYVELPNGSRTTSISDTYYTYELNKELTERNFTFKVVSSSNNQYTLDSNEKLTIEATRLAAVTNLHVQGDYLTWDSVSKAQSYTVSVDGNEETVSDTKFKLNIETGSHIVKIKANGNKKELISSSWSEEKNLIKLSTPTNLKIENYILSWDQVEGATSYEVVFDNGADSRPVDKTSFTINRSDIKLFGSLFVRARGDGALTVDSKASETKLFCLLETPVVKVSSSGVEWTKSVNASGYQLRVGDYLKNVDGESYSFDEFEAGVYTVSVVAIGDNNTYFTSDDSTPIAVRKLGQTTITVNSDGISWERVIGASAYEIKIDNETPVIVNKATLEKAGPLFSAAGKHTVSVRAKGDYIESIDSAWTSVIQQVGTLSSPTISQVVKDGNSVTITASDVAHSNGYIFNIDGIEYESLTNTYTYEIKSEGKVTIKVAAKGDGVTYVNSAYGVEKTFSVLPQVQNVRHSKETDEVYVVTWNPVSSASGYRIIIRKYVSYSNSEPDYEFSKTFKDVSMNIGTEGYEKIEIIVVAMGDGDGIFDSAETKYIINVK